MVKLAGYGERRPAQLSGGQRQRVALARALVNGPKVLLLDEPLGALDLKLREQMQEELKALQQKLGITFVFVTHDQGEALSMADRVAVFNDGRIVQVGTPADIYERPRSRFVADFVGSSNVCRPTSPRAMAARPSGPASGLRRSASSPAGAHVPASDCAHRRRGQDRSATKARRRGSASRPRARGSSPRCRPTRRASTQGDSVRLIWPKSAMVTMEDGA